MVDAELNMPIKQKVDLINMHADSVVNINKDVKPKLYHDDVKFLVEQLTALRDAADALAKTLEEMMSVYSRTTLVGHYNYDIPVTGKELFDAFDALAHYQEVRGE